MTAAARALHREEPPPWVLDDRLALGLAGDEGVSIAKRLHDEMPTGNLLSFSRWMCVRARLAEDVVERAVAAGIAQYVILGAGLDSFAYRRPDLLERLRVFEVDHPASQAWKRQRVAELGAELPDNLVFAPVDFELQTLRDGLLAAGFDFASAAVFSWIGVTMYLTLRAIEATLEAVAACPRASRIVLTYNLPPSALDDQERAIDSRMSRLTGEMGEPWISFFTPAEAETLVRRCGFAEVDHFGPEQAIRTYFGGRPDVRLGMPQRLLIATVGGR
ncbi:MAG TPA: class I SAM-dependent methyltransferase [Candidatus Dormibacteraeota bacterium]|nr:class I SAM-dependent methyltransferase [Candidatus Dormibacteraeota bacterium]